MRHILAIGGAALFVATMALAAPPRAMESQPEAEAIIRGRHTAYVVRFDQPIDHAASALDVLQGGKIVQHLVPRLDSAPEVLYSAGETPAAGVYLLQWRARAANGETSEGSIPFSTAP